MKRKIKHSTPGFDVKPFLREIELKLPTVKSAIHQGAILGSRDFLLHHASELARPNQAPALLGMLVTMLDTLRCCGVVPQGWPPAPLPDEKLRIFMVPIVDIRGEEGAQ